MTSPVPVLEHRLAERRARAEALARADARFGWARLAAFAALGAALWAVFAGPRLAPWLLALPAAAFLALVVRHAGVLRARARALRAAAFHEAALARIAGTWAGRGDGGARFADPEHPYAQDLDLFGKGSLFELLDQARTAAGEARLAAWLLAPAPAGELRARQRAVAELAPRLDLREDLAVLGEDVRASVEPGPLAAWAEAPPHAPAWVGPAGLALAAGAAAALAGWALGAVNGIPLVLVLLVQWGFVRSVREPVDAALVGTGRSAAELEVLALLLARLEREPFEDGRLAALRAALSGGGAPASARVAELSALVRRLEWAHNQLFALAAFALSWRPLHAVAVDRWRARAGGAVRGWLEAVAELEALSSLAGYAHEHPEDVVPEILDASPGNGAAAPAPAVRGEALRHPLLRGAVPNDVHLGGPDGPRVLLVSGSNMSGKSTYLRTVGVNVVLALAGAPVRARRLALTPLALGATLRIQDSLQAGRSRFYAEIARLKALDDLARGPFPLLFLLDEILHGTNSHDRRIGAEAVIRGLVALGAIGFVTTHDLALTALAGREGEAGALANAHFEDEVKGGEIVFDYELRPGVVTRSNALDLMRAVGLRV